MIICPHCGKEIMLGKSASQVMILKTPQRIVKIEYLPRPKELAENDSQQRIPVVYVESIDEPAIS